MPDAHRSWSADAFHRGVERLPNHRREAFSEFAMLKVKIVIIVAGPHVLAVVRVKIGLAIAAGRS